MQTGQQCLRGRVLVDQFSGVACFGFGFKEAAQSLFNLVSWVALSSSAPQFSAQGTRLFLPYLAFYQLLTGLLGSLFVPTTLLISEGLEELGLDCTFALA